MENASFYRSFCKLALSFHVNLLSDPLERAFQGLLRDRHRYLSDVHAMRPKNIHNRLIAFEIIYNKTSNRAVVCVSGSSFLQTYMNVK